MSFYLYHKLISFQGLFPHEHNFLKSNIFCDEDKYKQNKALIDNFDPKLINHNNWYTNLDWRNNKSELIFYKDNQKEFYDNNSKNNNKYFDLYK